MSEAFRAAPSRLGACTHFQTGFPLRNATASTRKNTATAACNSDGLQLLYGDPSHKRLDGIERRLQADGKQMTFAGSRMADLLPTWQRSMRSSPAIAA
jgi:hypothetical protein